MTIDEQTKEHFRQNLLEWYSGTSRPLPWKETKDPYLIWLSEIILQQTRVEQGLPYYLRFQEAYPTIFDLAAAPEDEVMKLWQGLGYYSRARNLMAAAQTIVNQHRCRFPSSYKEIRELKGVGEYTAAAIASFAFGLPEAVVDGNVYRVLSRYFNISEPTDTTKGKQLFATIARQLLNHSDPGAHNQALMDFGATVCIPGAPDCSRCPFQSGCASLAKGTISHRPKKSKKIQRKTRYFNYLVVRNSDSLFLEKRQEKDIWRSLYQFPMVETEQEPQETFIRNNGLLAAGATIKSGPVAQHQLLTHQKVVGRFYEIEGELQDETRFIKVNVSDLNKFAYPRIVDWYLKEKELYLSEI